MFCVASEWGDYQPVAVLMHASAELLGQLPAVGPQHMKQQRLAYLMAAAAALGEWQLALVNYLHSLSRCYVGPLTAGSNCHALSFCSVDWQAPSVIHVDTCQHNCFADNGFCSTARCI